MNFNTGHIKIVIPRNEESFSFLLGMLNRFPFWRNDKGVIGSILPTSVFLLLTSLLIGACTPPKSLPEKQLSEFVLNESNGLYQKKQTNGMDISLYYKPTGLLVAQEADEKTKPEEIEQLENKYGNYAYFILDIAAGGKNALYATSGSMGAFSENLQTLAFRMDQYVNLTTSANDTIPVADFIYPRMYGMSKSATVMFVFSKEKIDDSEWVSFNLNEFGMLTGDQQFRFKTKDIKTVPKLKI